MAPFTGLDETFLAPYRAFGDPFQTLLARSTYLTKYSRDGETWTDTIARVVRGNMVLDPTAEQSEGERLFDIFWNMKALPSGRGLWTGGIEGMVPDARYNCWYVTLRSTEDWCWIANQLMLGGGVGVGSLMIDGLPLVGQGNAELAILCDPQHLNVDEVQPDYFGNSGRGWQVPDSREGWVSALQLTLRTAFEGGRVKIDVSPVRERGKPIKTFGGIACGPGPLVAMLRAVWRIIRGAEGRQLTRVECLDITNHIGLCIKSGNVRRSALIFIGPPDDQAFRDAKKNYEAVKSHRHTSNNSISFTTWTQIMDMDWESYADDVASMGEPGITNMPLVWLTDPTAEGCNPCGEQMLPTYGSCNLAEVFPARIPTEAERLEVFAATARYALRQRLTPLTDPLAEADRVKNMRVGVGIGGLCDFSWNADRPDGEGSLRAYYLAVQQEAHVYAKCLGVAVPSTCTTVKPSGTISLLVGSSPGIHAPYAPFYTRRVRVAKNEPLAQALIDAGVPHEDCVYDATKRTWVFSFPCAAPNATSYVVTESIRDQFVRQVRVQEAYADNAVSATLSFSSAERGELIACLREFVPRLKSTSCLPKAHGYEQAPYSVISEAEYLARYDEIDHWSPLVKGGELEIDECSTGACPVR